MAVNIPPGLMEAFETAGRSVFRLETLQHYAGDPNYDRFIGGQGWEDTESKRQWADLVRRRTSEGVVMQRVQLVQQPLTDYMRFRFAWSNPVNIWAGEDVRIVLAPVEGLLYAPDFWMFDETTVFLMRYDSAGALTDVVDVTGDRNTVVYRHYAEIALELSMPLVDGAAQIA